MSDQNRDEPEFTPQEEKILSQSPADSPNIIDDEDETEGPANNK